MFTVPPGIAGVPEEGSVNVEEALADVEANANDALWQAKHGYLNAPWFVVRASIYLLCWTGLAWPITFLKNVSGRLESFSKEPYS